MIKLQVKLLSDACFAGSSLLLLSDADTCQELDEFGLPIIGARSLRGLLVEQCAVIFNAMNSHAKDWIETARRLYGYPGGNESGVLRLSDARMPKDIIELLQRSKSQDIVVKRLIARSMTIIRRQTRIDENSGTAKDGSLRATRMAKKGLCLESSVYMEKSSSDVDYNKEKALLAACVRLVKNGGVNRSRGWGRIDMSLLDNGKDITSEWMEPVRKTLMEKGE
jgi:hypothetical protein